MNLSAVHASAYTIEGSEGIKEEPDPAHQPHPSRPLRRASEDVTSVQAPGPLAGHRKVSSGALSAGLSSSSPVRCELPPNGRARRGTSGRRLSQ